jgi:hypothetical protein
MGKRTRLTHPLLKQDSWTLWEGWVLATVVGGLVGMVIVVIVSAIASQLEAVSTVALLHVVGGLEGAALGLAQWLVLRRYVKRLGWWIVATMVGAIAAWLIGLKVSVMLILIFFDSTLSVTLSAALLKAIFLLGAWVGAVLGLTQWLVLRTHVRHGVLWIVANAVAWGLGLVVALIGATFVKPGKFGLETALIGATTGTVIGAVIGAVTGVALVWLLKPRLLRHH